WWHGTTDTPSSRLRQRGLQQREDLRLGSLYVRRARVLVGISSPRGSCSSDIVPTRELRVRWRYGLEPSAQTRTGKLREQKRRPRLSCYGLKTYRKPRKP